MRIPVTWLTEHLELDEVPTPEQLADAFVRVGIEVDDIRPLNAVTGPLVVGRVVRIEELTGFKKPIRYCQVEVGVLAADAATSSTEIDDPEGMGLTGGTAATAGTGEAAPDVRGIICGATNFAEGDLIVAALPGAVLPGGFAISARKTYGHVSNGMICSAKELGIGDDHSGILVLPPGTAAPGTDAVDLLGLDDTVLEVTPTPDRGFCFSVRGLARELACALDVPLIDPAMLEVPPGEGEVVPVHIEDEQACSRFVLRRVTDLDATAPTPWFIRRRLMLAGIRSISLAVDVTNYVMLELGQPLHAFDAGSVKGSLVVRRARPGEKLTTLDDVQRELASDDIVICDDTGPISLAGIMGGASTEISDTSTDVLLEAAHWDPASISRGVRRHKLPSEAARRFERFTDPALPPAALERAARLLREYGEGRIHPGRTDVGRVSLFPPVSMPIDLPDKVAGVRYARGVTARRLQQIGCAVEVTTSDSGVTMVTATPPTWRSDLRQPADLVEEVLRLEGYDSIPSVLPTAPAGRGLTEVQRRRRTVARALAEAGYVEVLPFPFTSPATWDAFGFAPDDVRRNTVKVLNPLESERDELATTLLPGLLESLQRNVSRGQRDVALFHVGQVTLPSATQVPVPDVPVATRPSDAELSSLLAALPRQPLHVAVVLAGQRQRTGWWGKGEPASWADAVQAAKIVAEAYGVELRAVAVECAPWHPGRCAELRVGDWPVGHAGELHPKVVEALGLPRRTCAMELDLDALPLRDNRPVPLVSPFPPVLLDVALVVDAAVPAADVAAVLRGAGGDLLEEVRLFDVYTGEQVGAGKRSLAYSMRFRALDRTLTVEEATASRDAAVAAATERFGATLRG
ncbi:phenylalanine--tRNA ligase subunit beta [Goodfellowiella coeruleoviolacea]|uniref:Phenylalanine--tRNA ligase beta subunit n=1 Tax=Goodfellowiella coeruleoviolacea TaxID=334858 RepID=A0AAE3GLJ2_9PSEU|nr:phenylalanine--tRNA ligase subunit beta [Goodfellowiella coeruleoviolacea]MCP2168193.1 phenylalanyl-tRNA synthetase beta subunit [Goodfellowiella coeruleoviolacea]